MAAGGRAEPELQCSFLYHQLLLVIPINTGRQLFVDDFLIQSTTLTRTQHQPLMYPGNPILTPSSSDTTGERIPL